MRVAEEEEDAKSAQIFVFFFSSLFSPILTHPSQLSQTQGDDLDGSIEQRERNKSRREAWRNGRISVLVRPGQKGKEERKKRVSLSLRCFSVELIKRKHQFSRKPKVITLKKIWLIHQERETFSALELDSRTKAFLLNILDGISKFRGDSSVHSL